MTRQEILSEPSQGTKLPCSPFLDLPIRDQEQAILEVERKRAEKQRFCTLVSPKRR